jgi:DNA-binding NarL/FixJ family response regulator
MPMRDPIRVVIADDHPLFRSGLRAALEATGRVEVLGEAESADGAVTLCEQVMPDVVLMDLMMGATSGIDATRAVTDRFPTTAVLVVTMLEDDYSVFAAMRAGARGYVLKDADEDVIMRAIEAVVRGEAIFSPAIAARMIDFFSTVHAQPPQAAFPELTAREREVLHLIAQGLNNKEIADRLFLSPKTVRNHITNTFDKLQVVDRAQAIVKARTAGLGQ